MASLALGLIVASFATLSVADKPYAADVAKFRANRENSLTRKNGWLAVAGLFWLKEGENSVGSAPGSDVPLPTGEAPAHAGTLFFQDGKATFQAADGVPATLNHKPINSENVPTDATGKAGVIRVGDIAFTVIVRGKRTGVRLYDNQSKARKAFTGLHWYPVDPKLCVKAKFIKYPKVKMTRIIDIIGDINLVPCPGYAEFNINGKTCRLMGEDQGDTMFFNFRDATSGDTTYPAGRFLDAPSPKNGWVTIDFNKAYNPPCAFTAFATCPLPPAGNQLSVPIHAGEKTHHPVH